MNKNRDRQLSYINEDSHSSQNFEQQHYDLMAKKLDEERFMISQKINEQFILDNGLRSGMYRKSINDQEDSNEDLSGKYFCNEKN